MKKMIVALLVLAITSPVWATGTVTVTVVPLTATTAKLSYAVTVGTEKVRAFGIDVTVDNYKDITAYSILDSNYGTHVGTMAIDSGGTVTDAGQADGDPNDSPADTQPGVPGTGVSLEMSSLYGAGGVAPGMAGDLISFTVSGNCYMSLADNTIRGGIVMEDGTNPTVVYTGAFIGVPCLNQANAPVALWNAWMAFGRPTCWCYDKNCRGDADGKLMGPAPVGGPDLNLFKASYLQIALPANGICCDFDHKPMGPARVGGPDLNIIKLYYLDLDATVPVCPLDWDGDTDNDYNFWETPPP